MYQLIMPANSLQPFIECYWQLRLNQTHLFEVTEAVFVDNRADIIFNFGAPYHRTSPIQATENLLVTHSNLDAPRNYPVSITQQGHIHLIGIRFKPGGLSAFIPIPINQLTNQVIHIDDIFGPEIKNLESLLFDQAVNNIALSSLLNQFFLQHLALHKDTDLVFEISRQITDAQGQVTMTHLSRTLGYSSRHLDRIYQQVLGISPKFHSRVIRFHYALRHLAHRPHLDTLDLVERCSYYDQSHLWKDFMAFTGQNPKQYQTHLLQKAAAPPPNLVRFLQDNDPQLY